MDTWTWHKRIVIHLSAHASHAHMGCQLPSGQRRNARSRTELQVHLNAPIDRRGQHDALVARRATGE